MSFCHGQVKSYNPTNGIGLIELTADLEPVQFSIEDFPDAEIHPFIGEKVSFRIIDDTLISKAVNITRLEVGLEPLEYSSGTTRNIHYDHIYAHPCDHLYVAPRAKNHHYLSMFAVLMVMIVLAIVFL